MERILEAELMEAEDQVRAYARADFSTSNQLFVDRLIAEFGTDYRRVVDLGCGPCEVMVRLARARPELQITAVDGSRQMITLARETVRAAGLEKQITLVAGLIPGALGERQAFEAVLAKDLLHHMADPQVLWREVQRLGQPGAIVFGMDLIRQETPEAAWAIVERVAGGEDPVLKQDFYRSLGAAFTVGEVEAQLQAAGLKLRVTQVSERHMVMKGRLGSTTDFEHGCP